MPILLFGGEWTLNKFSLREMAQRVNDEQMTPMSELSIDDPVRCYVPVAGSMVAMHLGTITEMCSGYCMVDRMSLHGGAPWVCSERWMRKVTIGDAANG